MTLRVYAICLLVAMAVSGCAVRSFPDYTRIPHPLGPNRPPERDTTTVRDAQPPVSRTGVSYGEALAYLRGIEDLWDTYTMDRGAYPESLSKALIPLTGAGLGLAAAGVSGSPIIGLGAATATGLGIGALVQNRPRLAVYRLGITALQCVRRKTAPFDLAEEIRKDVISRLTILRGHAAELDAATKAVKDILQANQSLKDEAIWKNTAASGEESEAVLAAARQTIKQGVALDHAVRRVGRIVVDAVDDIKTIIDTAALDTVGDVASALNQVRFPGQGVFGGLATPPKTTDRTKVQPTGPESAPSEAVVRLVIDLRAPVARMEKARPDVIAAIRDTTALLETINVQTMPGLQDCLDQAEAKRVATELRVIESADVEVKQGGEVTVVVTGGTGSYSVTPLGTTAAQLDVTAEPIAGATRVRIAAKAAAVAGVYHILVKDTASGERLVKVTVKPGAA